MVRSVCRGRSDIGEKVALGARGGSGGAPSALQALRRAVRELNTFFRLPYYPTEAAGSHVINTILVWYRP